MILEYQALFCIQCQTSLKPKFHDIGISSMGMWIGPEHLDTLYVEFLQHEILLFRNVLES